MTLRELDDLCKRKKINDRRVESYSAQIACLLYNINRGDNPAMKTEEFMAQESKPAQEQTSEQMKHIAKLITVAFGGELK